MDSIKENTDLFTELSDEESASVSGGHWYYRHRHWGGYYGGGYYRPVNYYGGYYGYGYGYRPVAYYSSYYYRRPCYYGGYW